MEDGYDTQLGRWFKGGRELSGGQWQKIALSRAFMRSDADILVLDEPTAAMDAAADRIIAIHDGEILEQGNHESLLAENGPYASLFRLQAKGYQ